MHLSQPGRHHHHHIIVSCHATGCRADYQSVLEVRAALRRLRLTCSALSHCIAVAAARWPASGLLRAVSDGSYPAGAIGKVYVYSSSLSTSHTATGTHMPYGIAQCYLPPGRGDLPAFTPANAGARLSYPGAMQG